MLTFDLETSCKASEILHHRTCLPFFKPVLFFFFSGGGEKCHPFCYMELVFLLR